MRGDPYKHPTRPTSGFIMIRICNDDNKFKELMVYLMNNYIRYNIKSSSETVYIHLRKFNNIDKDWNWLVKYKFSLNDIKYQ